MEPGLSMTNPTTNPTTHHKMDPEIKAEWIADLRSGNFNQGRNGYLCQVDHDYIQGAETGRKYCCMGVLADQAARKSIIDPPTPFDSGFEYDGNDQYLSAKICEWSGLPESDDDLLADEIQSLLASMNDGHEHSAASDMERKTFSEIADWIEENL